MSSDATEITPYILTAKYTEYVDIRKEFPDKDAAIGQAKKMPRGFRRDDRRMSDIFDLTAMLPRRCERISVRVVRGAREWLDFATLHDDGLWHTGQGLPPVDVALMRLRTDGEGQSHVVYRVTERRGALRSVPVASVVVDPAALSEFTADANEHGFRVPETGEVVPVSRLTTSYDAATKMVTVSVYAEREDPSYRHVSGRESFATADEAERYILEWMSGDKARVAGDAARVVALCHAVEKTEVLYAKPKDGGSSLDW